MDQYLSGNENAVYLEMHLPGFSESQGLVCSKALNHDLCLNAKDMMFVGLSGLDVVPDLPAVDAASHTLEADLNVLPLYPLKDCTSVQLLGEAHLQPLQYEWDLGLGKPRGGGRSAGRGKRPLGSPRTSLPGCSHCGKVFSSASALSKHCLTHSQKREHVCTICSKAFKRPDRLSRHMLMHLKIKPFVCLERDCNESYCDHRSLCRHYKLQQSLCSLKEPPKEGPREQSPLIPSLYIPGSGKTVDGLTACSESGSFPPKSDLLRCAVNSFANQKLPLAAVSSAEQAVSALPDSSPASQASCLASNSSGLSEAAGDNISKDCLSCQQGVPSSNIFTNLTSRSFISEAPLPSEPAGLQCCPSNTLPCFPVFRGQKLPANQSSSNFQWIRNVPVCTKPKRNNVCLAHKSPVAVQGVSEELAGPSCTFSAAYEHPDALSFPIEPFKAEEDARSKSALPCFEEAFQLAKTHNSHPWENARELSFPEVQKCSALQSKTGQLFLKAQEPAACLEPLQVQQHFFQVTPKSQQVLSCPLEAEHSAANPLQARFQQQPTLAPQLLQLTEYEGPSTYLQKAIPQFQGILSGGEKQGLQPAPLKEYLGLRDSSVPSQPQYAVPGSMAGSHSSGRSNQLENKASALKEESKDGSAETGGKPPVGAAWSWCLPAIHRETLTLGLSGTAPPSQVAMASFSSAPAASGTRRLTIFNRIQVRRLVQLYNVNFPSLYLDFSLSNKTGAAPADGSRCESSFLHKNCGQLFYTENGLESHRCFRSEQWHLPQRKEEQQKLMLEAAGDGNCPSKHEMPLEDLTVAPLVIPVSVPVMAVNSQAGSEVGCDCIPQESPDGKDLKESLHKKKRKRQMRPKSLFIPPPLVPEAQPGVGGCYQSNLRSPVFLVDHLLSDLFQSSPYTPPPMLSPMREGSGLYFSTCCSSSASGDPNQLFSAGLGRMDRDFGFCLMKDNTKIRIQLRINVGSEFQAELPDLQDRSDLEEAEEPASLVWKPWGDMATNLETQDRVTELLKLACSSAMPGGGTNIELALHCLHEAQGNVMEALEMLLSGGPQKSESHPLANYHYAGSDTWTSLEKELFKKAFRVHKKDFHLIQKEIQTKSVSQCVEYYYTCKKNRAFCLDRDIVMGKRVKRVKYEMEETEKKVGKLRRSLSKESKEIKQKSYERMPRSKGSPPCGLNELLHQAGSADLQDTFPCKVCERYSSFF
uniref:Zinc finger protein 541 n=1 Tax=Accipiter nisus TaxID=211598 RepID=A0A8B9M145_9AVES